MKRIVLLAVLLAGCAQPVDVKGREEAVFTKYQGRHVSDLSVRWGPPEQAITRPQGTIYTYVNQSTALVATSMNPATPATPVPTSCRVMVYTDWSSNIIGLNHSGVPQACAEMYSRLH